MEAFHDAPGRMLGVKVSFHNAHFSYPHIHTGEVMPLEVDATVARCSCIGCTGRIDCIAEGAGSTLRQGLLDNCCCRGQSHPHCYDGCHCSHYCSHHQVDHHRAQAQDPQNTGAKADFLGVNQSPSFADYCIDCSNLHSEVALADEVEADMCYNGRLNLSL